MMVKDFKIQRFDVRSVTSHLIYKHN